MANFGLHYLSPNRFRRSRPFSPGTAMLIILVLLTGRSLAQQDYFVLIQSENNQPFYARLGEKTYSSSIQGHLIISQLKDSTYRLLIGFPRELFPEQEFSLVLHKKDLEFRLKNLGEKGWGLFNPQTLELKMAIVQDSGAPKLRMEGVKKDDAFSRLMAGVVSDTAVMYAMEPSKDSIKAIVKDSLKTHTAALADSSYRVDPVKNVRVVAPVNKFDTSALAVAPVPGGMDSVKAGTDKKAHKATVIEKLSEQASAGSLKLLFAEKAQGRRTDTIQVIIPLSGEDGGGPALTRSDCKNAASDYDVDQLRLRLLSANKVEAKIGEARKVFESKCFTTKQIRALSEVFAAQGSKFRFLEAAYPYISDDQFRELSGLFTDPAYISKFKALAGG